MPYITEHLRLALSIGLLTVVSACAPNALIGKPGPKGACDSYMLNTNYRACEAEQRRTRNIQEARERQQSESFRLDRLINSPTSHDGYCEKLRSDAVEVIRVRQINGSSLSDAQNVIRSSVRPDNQLAERLDAVGNVWSERRLPDGDIPLRVENTCRQARGMSIKQPDQKYRLSCEYMAESNVRAVRAAMRQGYSLDAYKRNVRSLRVRRSVEKYAIEVAEIGHLHPDITPSDHLTIALEKCRADPSITEVLS